MIERIQFFLIALMLIGAPILGGGKSVYSLLFLELLGIVLLGLILWQRDYVDKFSRITWITLALGLSLPILYLIPLPLSLWELLPGRSQFLEGLNWYKTHEGSLPWLSLSLVPEKTVHAILALIPLLAVFLAVSAQSSFNLIKLSYLLILLASIEAIWGIAQYTTQIPTLFPFGAHDNTAASNDAIGSYLNRDHFVALLYMVLPIALGQFFYRFKNKKLSYKENGFDTGGIIKTTLLIIAIVLLTLGAMLSRSRAGIFLTIVALIASTIVFARHIGGKRSASLISTIIISTIGIALSIGMIPILNRFIALDPFEDGRWSYFEVTLGGIKQFFPIGTGPSTFQEIYRTMQPYDHAGFLNHVHNDYLELVFECGLLGLIFLGLGFLSYLKGWFKIRKAQWDEMQFLKTACGLSVGLLLIHALVDFNFHTPANALVFSLLLSIFLKEKES